MTAEADQNANDPTEPPPGDPSPRTDPALTGAATDWTRMTWQDVQAIALALEECHPEQALLPLSNRQLAVLVSALSGFSGRAEDAPDPILSAIMGAWIEVREGEDDSSPYEYLA